MRGHLSTFQKNRTPAETVITSQVRNRGASQLHQLTAVGKVSGAVTAAGPSPGVYDHTTVRIADDIGLEASY